MGVDRPADVRNGVNEADLRYLSTLVGDARTHLEAAQSALATATAWTAIMLGRQDDDGEKEGES
jgi:hypothetical protein